MAQTRFDLAVIGGGPAGYVAAARAARLGGKVALVERDGLGGTCLNRGCIPTKTLIHGASVLAAVSGAAAWGVSCGGRPVMDLAALLARKDQVVAGLAQGVSRLLAAAGVTVFSGLGQVPAPETVTVSGPGGQERLSARNILLCLGARPTLPPIPGLDLPGVVTSDALLDASDVPDTLAVIGGGVIGMEFACLFASLGSAVTVIEAAERILPMVDEELQKRLIPLWKRQGVTVVRGAAVSGIVPRGDMLAVRHAGRGGETETVCRKVLAAVGRRPAPVDGIVALPGLVREGPFVAVDAGMRTSIPGVFAAGDLTPGPMLAHVASAEGMVAAANAMGGNEEMDYEAIPACIYTVPEIAGVGLTEEQAAGRGLAVAVGRATYGANGRAQTLGEPVGLVKLVADAADGRILGAHLFGAQASELVAEAALAVRNRLTVRQLAATVHSHPSLSETLAEAARSLLGEQSHAA
ncbi:dihydrolipoyl dehydrogenase [Solidesulfovibrio sp.]|uniref:dihydrolipoyl dehydrogenase n=1 Tax=Solidesulfovibrio sp. TaxID=2910990 RepID=UPI0026352D00|nr:dihydrolipoyl dehydrogenase [Solidesulfovibrio sp.]